nr:hypothetical protein [Reyranella soli]
MASAQVTAWRTRSTSARRPKPPPRKVVYTPTASCGTSATLDAIRRTSVGDWLGIQTSTLALSPPVPSWRVTCAVQFIGSMVVCARYGAR